MMLFKNSILSFFIITAIGLTTSAIFLFYRSSSTPNAKANWTTDAFMEGVSTLIMDNQGKPAMKIMTAKLVHYNNNDMTQFIAPELTIYKKSINPWFISAKYATAFAGIENIKFWDHVTIHHAADIKNPAMFINTNTLDVFPHKKIAKTSDLITMNQPNMIIKAKGLFADMNTGDIKLLSQTRGEYVPNY